MITFPVDCVTPAERIEYATRAEELLRQIHNRVGKWFKEGITQAEWDKLPLRVKNRLPYKPQLTKAEWDGFVSILFLPASQNISEGIVTQKELLKQSTHWTINLGDLI